MVLLLRVSSVVAAAALSATPPPRWHQLSTSYSYDDYVSHFRPYSAPTGAERRQRAARFERKLAQILAHNADPSQTWKMGVNPFTDLSEKEFAERLASPASLAAARAMSTATVAPPAKATTLPATVDWRTKGILTAVKDQGSCGSCWAFATTEMVESYAAMSRTPPVLMDLSPQQLVSCAPNPNDCGGVGGCDGSVPELAFDYLKQNGMASGK